MLEILQNIFYRSDAAREAFVEMCADKDVQKLTFDSYLYKRVVAMNPWQQIKLTLLTLGAVLRGNALAPQSYRPVPSAVRSTAEADAMLAVSSIRGGINASKQKRSGAVTAPGTAPQERREPAGVA